jgi:hypothetical protein
LSEPARGSQESGNQLIEGVNVQESTTGTLEYASAVAETAQDLGPLSPPVAADLIGTTSTDESFSSSSNGSGPVQLIGESETSEAMQMAGAAAGSLAPEAGRPVQNPADNAAERLSSTGALPGVTADGPATGGLSLSAASVGAALAATGAPLPMAPVSPADSPASGSVAKVAPSPMTAEPTEPATAPHAYIPDPPSSLGASAAAGRDGQPSGSTPGAAAPFNRPGRSNRSPDTGAFVPREVIARRRAAEAMTRAIVMAPPLPPSMMSAAQQAAQAATPSLAQPASGPITQPDGNPQAQTAQTAQQSRASTKSRKRSKGRKHGAHTAGIPVVTTAPTAPGQSQEQPPTGPMQMPGTGAVPMGYPNQGYPQGYAPQGYVPQGYVPQGYVPQGYVPAGYVPQGYQQGVPTGAMPLSAMGSVGMPTATPQQQRAGATPPGQHGPSKGARLAMLAAVVVVIGGIVAGVLFSQRGDGNPAGDSNAASPTPSASATQAVATTPLNFTALSFDPKVGGQGFKTEGPSYPSANWYASAQFGNLKDGIGLILDLGSAQKVSSVSVDVGASPITVGLRATDTLAQSNLSSYDKVQAQIKKTGSVTMNASKAGAHRYWMVWVTSLAPTSVPDRYRVTLDNVKVLGSKS